MSTKIKGLVFLDQHGCAKNKVDGELLIHRLSLMGLTQTFEPEKADFIIINSCGFIESAKKESLDAVYGSRAAYPNAKILLAGCLAERYAKLFKTELPEADGIFGNGDLSKIDEVVKAMFKGERPVLVPEQKGVCCGDRSVLLNFRGSAYVKITEGCNNCCSFCAIPIIRGKLRSRPAQAIIEEIKALLKKGIYEINLIGQDSAAWGTGEDDDVFGNGREPLAHINAQGGFEGSEKKSALCRLLEQISALHGNFRLRLLYIHPDHFNRDILPVIKADKRLLPYFDIPFQCGDDKIIRSMNRIGTAELYKKLIEDIRKVLPEVAIRTTFMTGFPGEDEQNFENTCNFMKSIEPDWSGCFEYSREEDTPAYNFKGKVPKKIAAARAKKLVEIQSEITQKRLSKRINKDYDVLIEEVLDNSSEENGENSASPSDSGTSFAIGRAWFQAPEVDGAVVVRFDSDDKTACEAVKPGNVVKVHAVALSGVDLDAVFIGKSDNLQNQTGSNNNTDSSQKDTTPLKFAVEEQDSRQD